MGIFGKKTTSADTKKVADKKEDNKKVAKTETKKAPAKKAPVKEVATKTDKVKNGNAYRILVKPLVTEKAGILGQENKYVFEVSIGANKIEIAKAIEEVYGIMPITVNTMKRKGKKVRRGRTIGKRKDWKKAIVELPKGKTIKVYEGV